MTPELTTLTLPFRHLPFEKFGFCSVRTCFYLSKASSKCCFVIDAAIGKVLVEKGMQPNIIYTRVFLFNYINNGVFMVYTVGPFN